MHHGCGRTVPSSVFSKISACCLGAVDKPPLIALKRPAITLIAATVLPVAVPM
jgi:hypothetical protein